MIPMAFIISSKIFYNQKIIFFITKDYSFENLTPKIK